MERLRLVTRKGNPGGLIAGVGDMARCKGCGSRAVHLHHLNPVKGDKYIKWSSRKVVPLCSFCHKRVHQGLYSGPSLRG
jgi:predicted HNH restriction endonuclease